MDGNDNNRQLGTPEKDAKGAGDDKGVSDVNKGTGPLSAEAAAEMIFGIPSHSPPKFVTAEDIMTAADGVANMALAHEIAVDENFLLDPKNSPKSEFRSKLEGMMHKAFFDLMRERISSDPPAYEQAFSVVEEIKKNLLACLMPHSVRTKEEIESKLDFELMAQQAKANTLDLLPYLQFCVTVMARLCSPARDEKIQEMSRMTDVPNLMQGILETLEAMRLDVANFTIAAVRPHIQAQSVEYEQLKFADYLKVCPDGLKNTKLWLRTFCDGPKSSPNPPDMTNVADRKAVISFVMVSGYLELIQWDSRNPYPETCVLDAERYILLGEMVNAVGLLATIVLVAVSNAGPIAQGQPGFREKMAKKVKILLENESTEPKALGEMLAGVGELVVKDLEEIIKAHSVPALSGQEENHRYISPDLKASIIAQIMDAANPENPVRKVIDHRLRTFLETVLNSDVPTRIPPALTAVEADLTEIAGIFLQLTTHNRRVFMSYYVDIIDEEFGLTPKAVASDQSEAAVASEQSEAAASNPTSPTA